jgi:hypothetical protein
LTRPAPVLGSAEPTVAGPIGPELGPREGCAMQGHYRKIGGRSTYFPPFVNERFDGPPFWACTFTSLLNGANVGWLGAKEASHREVRALARASGDVDLAGGSRSSHMVRAMRVRYGQGMRIEHRTPEQVVDRLGRGWAMVAAVTYGGLPKRYRRWSPRFTGGHRIVLLGWQNGSARMLDPLADRDADYAGEWIRWSDVEPAWWAAEQLWFREGMFLPQPAFGPRTPLPAPQPWRVAAGATVDFLSPKAAGVVARRVRIDADSEAMFDATIELRPAAGSDDPVRTLIVVSSGRFRGYLVDSTAPGVSVGPPANGAVAAPAAAAAGAASAAEIVQARQAEWDRIRDFVPQDTELPPRPAP